MNTLRQPTRADFQCTSSIPHRSNLFSLLVGERPRRFSGSIAPANTAAFRALRSLLIYRNERGMVTALALLLLAVLTLLGTTAAIVTSTDLLIGANYKVSEGAFYAAEAGVEEARGRLRASAGTNMITDTLPTSSQWRAYIGTQTMAQAKGYNPSLSTNLRTDSLQSSMNYVVVIKHETNAAGNILYWGDDAGSGVNRRNTTTGNNIYIVTSTGYTANSSRTVEAEVTRASPISAPAAVYVEENTTVQGSSTFLTGLDGNGGNGCGNQNRPGLATSKPPGSVDNDDGHPQIIGTGGDPSIVYNQAVLDVRSMVNSLKPSANYTYTVTSETQTGKNWGTPVEGATQQLPSSCSVHNVVYYNTGGTFIKLTGQSSGCGILLVDGDLNIEGGFNWYGPILVTGSVTFKGGGDKQVTGAIVAGGSAAADLLGGNANVVYCSSAVSSQTQNLPLIILSWHEP